MLKSRAPHKRWPKGYCPIPPEKRIQKGEVRNPKGGPKGKRCIHDTLVKIGELNAPKETVNIIKKYFPQIANCTVSEAEMIMVRIKALTADPWAVDFMADRTEGKVPAITKQVVDAPKGAPLTDAQCAIAAKALGLQITKQGNEIVGIKEDGSKIIRVKEKDATDPQ